MIVLKATQMSVSRQDQQALSHRSCRRVIDPVKEGSAGVNLMFPCSRHEKLDKKADLDHQGANGVTSELTGFGPCDATGERQLYGNQIQRKAEKINENFLVEPGVSGNLTASGAPFSSRS